MEDTVQLKVAEAFQDDVNKGIVRIDSSYMQKAGIRPGDIVGIEGDRKSVAIADRAYPSDIGQDIIRMDGLIRRNAGTSIGELVTVRKADVTPAKKVTIAPAKKGLVVRAAPEIFKHGLLGRAVVKGDVVSLGGSRRRRSTLSSSPFEEIFRMLDEDMTGFGFGDLKFIIADSTPKQAVIITSETEIVFNPEAVEVDGEEKSFDISYEDVGGLAEPIKKIREMVELPLKHPEIFEALGIEPPKGILLYGPPGTGKTLLAKAVANETNSHFITINGPEIMCVKGDTQLFTNPSGYVEAQSLYDGATGTKVEEGRVDVIELDEPIKTYAYQGSVEPAKITHVAKLTAQAFNVRLSDGNEVVGSHNQPFLVYEGGDLVWKRLEELEAGDYVVRLNDIELPQVSEPIELEGDFVERDGKRALKGRNEGRSTWITVPERTSESLMEWVGLVLAEGYVADDSVVFANNDPKLRERYVELLEELFATPAKTYEDGRVVVYSKVLVQLARFFGMAPGKKVPQVPPMLYRLPEKEAAAFVKGYFDGDGTVALTGEYPTPILYSVSKPFLKQLQGLLQLKLGIATKLAEHKTELGLMHKLTVRGHEGRKRFAQLVVPVSEKKRERLAKLPDSGKEWEHIPTPKLLLAHLRGSVAYAHYRNSDFYVYEKGPFTRYAMTKLYDIAKEHSQVPEIVEREYATLMRRDIAFERIESIVDDGEQELYDFTVDKDSFTAEPYLLLHNSKYYGQSEQNLRKKFEEAEQNAPAIIFIDEIDAIASKREEAQGEVEKRVVAQMLAIMDGLKSRGKVVVIAATNMQNQLDPALRRPGRFDREIEIGPPGKQGRLDVMKIHTRYMPLLGSLYGDLAKERISARVEREVRETPALKPAGDEAITLIEDPQKVSDFLFRFQKIEDVSIGTSHESDEVKSAKEELTRNELYQALAKIVPEQKIGEIAEEIRQDGINRDLEKIAAVTHGFVGADLAALAKEAALIVIRREMPRFNIQEDEPIPHEVLESLKIRYRDFVDALKIIRPSAMREVMISVPTTKWEDVAALENARASLSEAVEWPLKYPRAFEDMGIEPPKGILLYGPSGTGKTLLAKAVANEAEANFISVKGPELLSKWVGESEKAVRQIFDKARQNAPTIIFFDEFDSLAPRRGMGSDSNVTERVVNQLLTELDGLEKMTNVVVIGASNRPDIIDPSLLRPGRFDRLIHIRVPDAAGRKAILDVHTKRTPLALEGSSREDFLETVARKTDGFTGADIESLVREAAITALKRNVDHLDEEKPPKMFVTLDDFDKALETVKPSVTSETLQQYEQIEKTIREQKDASGAASYFG